jgi:hypothetical protein
MAEGLRLEHRYEFRDDVLFDPALAVLIDDHDDECSRILSDCVRVILEILSDNFDYLLR